MKQEEIIEGNRLIMQFMGDKIVCREANRKALLCNHKSEYWYIHHTNNEVYLGNNNTFDSVDAAWDYQCERVHFHTSWDWLMPVVEKIEAGNYGVKQCRKVVEIYYDDTKEVILKVKESSRILSLYTAILQFIKWYNKEK
jgi:hypothetical protein